MKRLFSSLAAIAIFGMGHASEAVGSPLASFGSDPESVARAMAATSSVNPTSAATVNPARLIDAKGIDIYREVQFHIITINVASVNSFHFHQTFPACSMHINPITNRHMISLIHAVRYIK